MSIFGQFYPLKDMIKNIENDQLDELYNSTKAVFWFSEDVQKSVSSLHKSAIRFVIRSMSTSFKGKFIYFICTEV